MGRKPEPTALRLAHGNPSRRPLNEAEPQPELIPMVPNPPDWLAEKGKEAWLDVAPKLLAVRVLTEVDLRALSIYCEAWDEFFAAKAEIEEHGMIAVSEKGGEYQHPAVGIKNKAIARIKQLGAEFGMTPSSRTGIRVEGGEDKDPLTEFLKRKKSS